MLICLRGVTSFSRKRRPGARQEPKIGRSGDSSDFSVPERLTVQANATHVATLKFTTDGQLDIELPMGCDFVSPTPDPPPDTDQSAPPPVSLQELSPKVLQPLLQQSDFRKAVAVRLTFR